MCTIAWTKLPLHPSIFTSDHVRCVRSVTGILLIAWCPSPVLPDGREGHAPVAQPCPGGEGADGMPTRRRKQQEAESAGVKGEVRWWGAREDYQPGCCQILEVQLLFPGAQPFPTGQRRRKTVLYTSSKANTTPRSLIKSEPFIKETIGLITCLGFNLFSKQKM